MVYRPQVVRASGPRSCDQCPTWTIFFLGLFTGVLTATSIFVILNWLSTAP